MYACSTWFGAAAQEKYQRHACGESSVRYIFIRTNTNALIYQHIKFHFLSTNA